MASEDEEEETVYCICRQPYDGERFMIECDVCKDWFHGSCVGVKETQAVDIEIYHCPNCQVQHGPLVLRKKRQSHRQDYSEERNMDKAFQTGTLLFVKELKSRTFPSADDVIVRLRDGSSISLNYFEENGFIVPLLVDNKDGLNLKVPPPNFSIQDVENYVGSLHEVDVIDVARQEDYRMLMREWTEYYNSTNREKVLNVISLEFTKTRLSEVVEPPKVVIEMSWVNNLWPKDSEKKVEEKSGDEPVTHEKPCVQRYCLMGVKDSYTDFHIDFGGTSVWYHVLRGEKVFYLIEPTSANMHLYETWVSSSNQSKMFFGDQVQHCYKCVVRQGQTLFIPTGWIHAVLTPIDSLVFGGNFLHSFNIELQIQVYEMEKRVKTPERYMYPNYETLHWYAAKHIYQEIREFLDNEEPPPSYLVSGAKCLVTALKSWTHKRDLNSRCLYIKRDAIPETIQYGKLLKDIQKQLRQVNKPSPPRPTSKKKRKLKDDPDGEASSSKEIKIDVEDTSQSEDIKVEIEDTDSNKGDLFVKLEDDAQDSKYPVLKPPHTPPRGLSSPKNRNNNHASPPPSSTPPFRFMRSPPSTSSSTNSHAKDSTTALTAFKSSPSPFSNTLTTTATTTTTTSKNKSSTTTTAATVSTNNTTTSPSKPATPRLTFRLPKAGAYMTGSDLSVYDFEDDEREGDNDEKRKASGGESDVDVVSPGTASTPPRVRLKSEIETTSGESDKMSSPDVSKGKMAKSPSIKSPNKSKEGGPFHVATSTSGAESSQNSGKDSDDENALVVEENPQPKKIQGGPGSLKLKLSVQKSQIKEPSSFDTSQDSSIGEADTTTASSSDYDSVLPDHTYTSKLKPHKPALSPRMSPPPRIERYQRPSSASDILAASSRLPSHEPFKIEELNKASPTMRDAIQGMLSMSQLTATANVSSLQKSPFILDREKSKATLRLERETKAKKYLAEDMASGEQRALSTAFKDDEYVYPSLEGSDNDEDGPIFKPRGRIKKDETWNPKVKICPNTPAMDRPARPLAKKEAVERLQEDAAAKLANKPIPKRQYIRKKPKEKPGSPALSSMPSTSRGYMGFASTSSDAVDVFGGRLAINQEPSSSQHSQKSGSGSSKKITTKKKGMATAKQRLGKILKLHKMGPF